MSVRRSPRIAEALLWLIVAPADRSFILGDLAEQYGNRQAQRGWLAAGAWYWLQVFNCVGPSGNRRLAAVRRAWSGGRHGGDNRGAPDPRRKGGPQMLDRVAQDIRYTLRGLIKEPVWAAAAVCTLALAIGATTAVFGIVNAVLLRPLPYERADQLVVMEFHPANAAAQEMWGESERMSRHYRFTTTYPNYEAWRDATVDVFGGLGAYDDSWEYEVAFGGDSHRVAGALVSANLIDLLRVQPFLGRAFRGDEDVPGSERVVVVSHAFWQRYLGGAAAAVGTTIRVRDEPHTIVGVMPAGFDFPSAEIQIWMPLAYATRGAGGWNYNLVGRLNDDVSARQAATLLADRAITVPARDGADREVGAGVQSLHRHLVGDVRPMLLVFMAAVTAVLLIACVNVVNLMLTRATGRDKEQVIRAALGAGRLRLAQQLLTESLMVSALGGALGLSLAAVLIDVLVVMNPTSMPRQEHIGIDAGVLIFTAALVIAVGLAVGLVPAFRAARSDLARGLNAARGASSAGLGQGLVRDGLVVVQLALALIVLVGGGLLVRSFLSQLNVETGVDARNVLAFETTLPDVRYPEFQDRRLFYAEMIERIEALPGVGAVGMANYLPAGGWFHSADIEIFGHVREVGEEIEVEIKSVTPGYFDALGVAVLGGRVFGPRDDAEPSVMVISESLARRYWAPGAAVGGRVQHREGEWAEVVGVVSDVRYRGMERDNPQIYIPYAGGSRMGDMDVVVRTAVPPSDLAAPVRSLIASMDEEVGVYALRPLEQMLSSSVAEPRFRALLLGVFGVAALALSVIGVYGVMSYAVAQRTRELGVRKALGASRGNVMGQVVSRGGVLTLIGLGLGAAGAYAATSMLQSYLFELDAHDPVTLVIGVLVLATASLGACVVPARRAANVDPLVALRAE